jgi:hypothetical protein
VGVEELLFAPRFYLKTHGIERSHDLLLPGDAARTHKGRAARSVGFKDSVMKSCRLRVRL